MAVTIQEFLVGLGFKVDQSSFKQFNSGLKKAAVAASAVGAAATAAAGLVSKFVTNTAQGFNQIQLLSERVNTSAESITKLGFVASLTGSSVEAVRGSLDRFNRTAGEAALGIGRGALAFRELGINARDSKGQLKDTATLMTDVGNKIKGFTSQKQVAVLERLGIDPTLVRALTSDVSGLNDEFKTMFDGVGINANQAAKNSEAFIDSITRMKFAFKTLVDAVSLRIMPKIKDGIDSLRRFMVDNGPKIIQAITPIVEVILRISSVFVLVVQKVGFLSGIIIKWFNRLNDVTHGWASGILAAAAAWKFLNLKFLASPLGIILSMIAAVGLLIDDFVTFKNGGESLIDWGSRFGSILKAVTVVVGSLSAAILIVKGATAAWAAAQAVLTTVMNAAKIAMVAFNVVMDANPISLIILAIAGLITAGTELITHWDTVKAWFVDFFGFMFPKFAALAKISSKLWGFVKNLFGGGNSPSSSQPPALAPSPQVVGALQRSNNNSVNQKTNIIIQGGPNAQATAKAVAAEQNRVNADIVRNMSGAVR